MNFNLKNSEICCVLFDLDNTLIETRKADAKACSKITQKLIGKYGFQQDCASTATSTFLKSFRRCPDNPDADLDSWRTLLWEKALGTQYSNISEKVYKEWLQYRYKYLALTSDIKSLLQDLREHFLLGLITNGPSASQWEKVDKLNIRSYFDVILVSGDFPWEKPHYKIFHKACDYLGVQPRQCIMVGDKLETDILGGLQANLGGTVWIPLSRSELDQGHPVPHHIIKNIGELVDLLPEAKTRRRSFRGKTGNSLAFNKLSLCDMDDGNSNSSDGS